MSSHRPEATFVTVAEDTPLEILELPTVHIAVFRLVKVTVKLVLELSVLFLLVACAVYEVPDWSEIDPKSMN